jgi:hypothetical protein
VTTSYNGWPASPHAGDFGGLDNREVPGAPGVHCAPGVRAGDVATVLLYVAEQFHRYVEPLTPGTCWGYNYRPDTNNPHVLSCHASGTAIDLNAPRHPNGVRGTFSAAQVAMIRTILAACGGVVTWGGDFRGVDDEMHFEIDGDAAAVAAVAARLAGHPAPAPAPAPVVDDVAWTGHDLTGAGDSLRGEEGDQGPRVLELQHELNTDYPAYSHLAEDGEWGHQTSAVLDEYAERNAHEADTPAADRQGLHDADGRNIGPRLARALHHDGLI